LRVLPTEAEQSAAMRPGLRRLLRLTVPSPVKAVERALDPRARLVLGNNPHGSPTALLEDCADAAVGVLAQTPVWARAGFLAKRGAATRKVVGRVEHVLAAAQRVQLALPDPPPPTQADAVADIRDQLGRLLPAGFVTASGAGRLADLTRYLTAIERRLERLPHAVAADRDRMARVHAVQEAYEELVAAVSPARAARPDIAEIRWMIEELRVSLWAQQLGTARPVSEQRIYRAIDGVQL